MNKFVKKKVKTFENFFAGETLVKKQRNIEMTKFYLKQSLKTLAIAAMATVAAGGWFSVTPAHAGEIELTDIQNAKLARHRARERVMKNEKQEDYIDDDTPGPSDLNDGDCGTVDIGNVVNNKGFGGPKEIDVIITGDIINANNDCN